MIYLDNNATTAVAPEVTEAMLPYFGDIFYNPSSMYECAKTAAAALKEARHVIASALGVRDDEITFNSCATESINTAIRGAAAANPKRKHIITSVVEHPAVLEVCREMARNGYEVDYIGVNEKGEIDMRQFVRALRAHETLMVTIMHANNETGVLFPIAKLATLTKQLDAQILFHTDATQSVTKMDIDLSADGYEHIDMLSFSGHKMHAPKGIGALFMRQKTPCRPFLLGGHQERGKRAGTENLPYIVGLAKAFEVAAADKAAEFRIERMRNRLERGLLDIPYIVVNGRGAERLPNTSNVSFHAIEGEGILYQLDLEGIAASSGSACTSGTLDPSHVLQAMHVPFTAVHGSIRFSLSRYTQPEDIEHVIKVMPGIVERLRKLSPFWDKDASEPLITDAEHLQAARIEAAKKAASVVGR